MIERQMRKSMQLKAVVQMFVCTGLCLAHRSWGKYCPAASFLIKLYSLEKALKKFCLVFNRQFSIANAIATANRSRDGVLQFGNGAGTTSPCLNKACHVNGGKSNIRFGYCFSLPMRGTKRKMTRLCYCDLVFESTHSYRIPIKTML